MARRVPKIKSPIRSGRLDRMKEPAETPGVFGNPDLRASYERAKKDARAGRVRRFTDVEALIRSLNEPNDE